MKEKKNSFHLEHWKIVAFLLVLYDVIAVNAAFMGALLLRFDFHFSKIDASFIEGWRQIAPSYTVVCILVFWWFRLYRSIWEFAGFEELLRILSASVITEVAQILISFIFIERMPISYYMAGGILQFILIAAVRFSHRLLIMLQEMNSRNLRDSQTTRIMLIGGGSAGQLILRDIRRQQEPRERVVCIIDDDRNKLGRYMEGVPIVGGRDDILWAAEKYKVDKIYFAIPSASAQARRDILDICKDTGCEMKSLPGLYQLVSGQVTVSRMHPVRVEELLGRDTITVDLSEIGGYLKDKIVLVTGGGGSIGSEICRQVAALDAKRLIIFEIYENNAYDIQQELLRRHKGMDLVVLIGSVRDSRRLKEIFTEYKPDIVFHAAAHKHVPLMETSPCEAIKNNVIGTYKTAYAAMKAGCERFVLISTDKAVNPTNIMGASKRLCEMVIQTFAEKLSDGQEWELPRLYSHFDSDYDPSELHYLRKVVRGEIVSKNENPAAGAAFGQKEDATLGAGEKEKRKTRFVAVRFGNVLGSNGSVIPLFKKQIEEGGPVTVTHPDIIRYFMTIPEAVSLVLQAGYYAESGNIYVLDMGDPVKIDTLAKNLIKLSGLKPGIDIQIEYTGLRPGEKLYEEKLMAEEGLRKTPNNLIHIGNPVPFDYDLFLVSLDDLMNQAYANDECIRESVRKMVSTYHDENLEAYNLDPKYQRMLESSK